MYIGNVVISNFRAFEQLHFDLSPGVNVIVGPNAIGKTTILQAIRLAKATLAPRSPNEAMQTLISLGAASPNFPQRLYLGALARDPGKQIEVRCTYHMNQEEIEVIENNVQPIVNGIIQARSGQAFANPAAFIQFLSSPPGRNAQKEIERELRPIIERIREERKIIIGFRSQPSSEQIEAIEPMSGAFLAFLDQRHAPQVSPFSYFPADRALPVGEVAVQLGAADTQQQLESHNSQPHLKYNRLKNLVFNSLVMKDGNHKSISDEFKVIFDGILKGRSIHSIGVNEIGLLSIRVCESDSGRVYELDSMSSGEKGLLLTFLLITKTVARNGIVLLDEPELHLNPAVCQELLHFMVDEYANPNKLQFIVCSHSPEILAGAFDRQECSLLRIVSERVISTVGKAALDEVSEALRQLGASVADTLLYKGTIFVEGDDDVAILRYGFSQRLKKYQIKPLGGRQEVEKTIQRLQEIERNGRAHSELVFLIFDKDKTPSGLKNSDAVRLIQWNRYCIENYLIDLDILTEMLKDTDLVNRPISSRGALTETLRRIALSQLDARIARDVYDKFGYQSPGCRASDVVGNSFTVIAESLFNRFSSARASLQRYDDENWTHRFVQLCEEEKKKLEPIWDGSWAELCDGKRLFADFYKSGEVSFRVPLPTFKKRIIQQMNLAGSDNWRTMDSMIRELIKDIS
jgi:energy-coupling factor transporter ATP-binding protein EcfA2